MRRVRSPGCDQHERACRAARDVGERERDTGSSSSRSTWRTCTRSNRCCATMGFGQPDGHIPNRIADGTVETRWTPGIMFIGDLLGVAFDDVHLSWETACTPVEIVTLTVGTFAAGTISAYDWMLSGRVGRALRSWPSNASRRSFGTRSTRAIGPEPRRGFLPGSPSSSREDRRTVRSWYSRNPGRAPGPSIPMTAMAVST